MVLSFRNEGSRKIILQQENPFSILKTKDSNLNSKTDWKFKDFDLPNWNRSQEIELQTASTDDYFRQISSNGPKCFTEGTDFTASETENKCVCLKDYFGIDCGIPDAVWFTHYRKKPKDRKKLKVRKHSRRLVHGVLVNHEFDFFETRVESLSDVVDAFIVQESNFTTFGTEKQLQFYDKFRNEGWLSEHQSKFIYVLLSHFEEKGKTNGWFADAYIRLHLTRYGLPLIHGLRDDDLFLLLDSDELPSREVLLFLKLYDGYTEPIRFGFRWTVFGFYWLKAEDPSLMSKVPLLGNLLSTKSERLLQLYVMCTMGMLKKVYSNNGMLLRRNVWKNELLEKKVHNYTKLEGHVIKEWEIGAIGHYAGYHCSWCYNPEGIRTKLLSAQKHDKPRWGDYPEKTNLTYISKLIQTGGWFDDTKPFIYAEEMSPEGVRNEHYAPKYILEHRDRFNYLLNINRDSEIP